MVIVIYGSKDDGGVVVVYGSSNDGSVVVVYGSNERWCGGGVTTCEQNSKLYRTRH